MVDGVVEPLSDDLLGHLTMSRRTAHHVRGDTPVVSFLLLKVPQHPHHILVHQQFDGVKYFDRGKSTSKLYT